MKAILRFDYNTRISSPVPGIETDRYGYIVDYEIDHLAARR